MSGQAVMDIDVVALRRAAAERRQGRRWQPVDARKAITAALLEGRDIPIIHNSWTGPEFNPPADTGAWLDDRLTERTWPPADPVTIMVFALAEAMRQGADAAAAAVRHARRLTPRQQYLVFATLMGWRQRPFLAAEPLMTAVSRQWTQTGLAERPPEDD